MQGVEDGALPGGLQAVITEAAKLYPANQVFLRRAEPPIAELAEALAQVVNDPDEAQVVLLRAGFPTQDLPNFRNPISFWHAVMADVAAGKILGGVRAVLDEVLRKYPHNRVFNEFRDHYHQHPNRPPKPFDDPPRLRIDPPRKDVRIGVLTALPKECAAFRLMLSDEVEYTAPGEGGGRTYYLGSLPAKAGGSHRVALALLPDMGNNSAAISAMRLLQHFSTVKHIVMCGIAGSIPRPGASEHDVRLGDIVVSDRNGVVQYDLVAEHPDGTREHRHPPRPPSAELLDTVRRLRTDEELGRRPWEAFLKLDDPTQRKWRRPLDDLDARGFAISYPPDPEREPDRPRVFHGTIAAANTLLKNPAHRDHLAEKFGVKAVEMESSGIADATWTDGAGYLVVRGICDYCDERKGDVWHRAAAFAAAAYVRALLGSLPAGRGT